jgi:hypothetical protein
MVVFHCALSQQRGPGAAFRYLRERERLLGARPKADGFTNSREELKSGSGKDEMGNEEEEEEKGKQNGLKDQKVYVLERGFVGWQEKFGEDERLTEGYRKELWKDGYWM